MADRQIKDPITVPYFFFALAPPLCSLSIQSDSKGKLDTSGCLVSNEKGGAPFNVSYILYFLQMSLLKSLKKKLTIASLI